MLNFRGQQCYGHRIGSRYQWSDCPLVSIFSNTSLVILRLVLHNSHHEIPTEVKLRSLKELCLQGVKFAESGDAQRHTDGCRTLNKLEFNGCTTGNVSYDMHLIIILLILECIISIAAVITSMYHFLLFGNCIVMFWNIIH
jgi:hypothetical protein